jgi:hypothetical protein
VTGGSPEATGTPPSSGEWSIDAFELPETIAMPAQPDAPAPSAIGATRFAHASEAEMARILDFYQVRWEYEPTTFPILWNLDGEVVESFAPDFYLPDLEIFLEMTTLRQRLVRKKNRKLRRLRELYPDIRIKLFYARDFRAMMLKYGRLGLAHSLSGTPGQVTHERPPAAEPIAAAEFGPEPVAPVAPIAIADPPEDDEPSAPVEPTVDPGPGSPESSRDGPLVQAGARPTPRSRSRRRRRGFGAGSKATAEREAGA